VKNIWIGWPANQSFHHGPAHIYGFFSGKQKLWIFDPANAE
jgi:hypothetical protein